MTTQVNLNETERKVLEAVAQQVIDCTGGEFGYLSDIKPIDGLSKSQMKGYFTQLVQKGMIESPNDEFGCYHMRKLGVQTLGHEESKYDTYS